MIYWSCADHSTRNAETISGQKRCVR
jgi:hypothetical protein